MKTDFAPAERASQSGLQEDIQNAAALPLIDELTHVLMDPFFILNRHRQIVYCNKMLIRSLEIDSPDKIYGLRPGEVLNCIHAGDSDGGCGTSVSCRYCGAVQAFLESRDQQETFKEYECRILADSGDHSEAMEFYVRAGTIDLSGKLYTVLTIRDAGAEKRREVLERIFFHDILNTAGGLHGVMELMMDAKDEELDSYIELARQSCDTLIEEIHAQKDLLAAENGHLKLEESRINTVDILSSIVSMYKNHLAAGQKSLYVSDDSEPVLFSGDHRLLLRVLGNMVKNALEAEPRGSRVTIGAVKKENAIEFWVHNPTTMPENVKHQIFQRSFTTKGKGRGLGTYSMKLLGETYLKGRISFESEQNTGTIFKIALPV